MAVTKQELCVTVGIPAYNESANIERLLDNILNQKLTFGTIKEIIVADDFSDDRTAEIVESMQLAETRIQLIRGKKRLGQARRQNQIFSKATGDVVVLLNADVLPSEYDFVDKIINPFTRDKKIGLVGARVLPIQSTSLIGRVLDWHAKWKTGVYEQINQADTIYLCHGRARAFGRKLYQQMKWEDAWGEDAFSYLKCKELGFEFKYVREASVWYASPQTLHDHIRQSSRFLTSRQQLSQWFDKDVLAKAYVIPARLLIKQMIQGWKEKPVYSGVYGLILGLSGILSLAKINSKSVWTPSTSTKTIRLNTGKL